MISSVFDRLNRPLSTLRSAALALLLVAGAPGVAVAEDNARGELLYGLCNQCHGDAGEGSRLALAPAIAGLPQWYVAEQLEKFQKGWRGGHPDDVGGMRMAPMSRWLKSDEDLQAIAAFVAQMPETNPEPVLEGGNAQRGQQLYTVCIACHQADGKGMEALKAPPLLQIDDWYQLTQLKNYKAGIRGWTPEDVNAGLMRGMAATLVDEQAIKDVIAYIMTLRR